jgi:hypothetical protein
LTGDEITLNLPADRDFYRVAHLVLGGLAVRLNLTLEHLEDLELALDGLLDRWEGEGDVTVQLRVADGAIETAVGPFDGAHLRRELERDGDELSLRRVLDTVVDHVELDDAGRWITLTKNVS